MTGSDGRDHGTPDHRTGDYRAARIGAATAIAAVVVFLAVVDALSAEYALDPIVLATLLTTMLYLLGVEAINLFRGAR